MKNIFLIIILLFLFIGCTTENKNNRFVIVYEQGSDFNKYFAIIEDIETEIQYIVVKMGFGAGIIKLEKKNE